MRGWHGGAELCTEEECECSPPAPAAPPVQRCEGDDGTAGVVAPGGGGTIGGVPKATSAQGEDPWGSQPGPGHHSQEGAERRPVPRGQFGDSGRARSIFGGSEATPDLPARQRARGRRRGGGHNCKQWLFVPRHHPMAPLRCPRCPAPACPKARGSWPRGGSWLWGGPEWPPDRAVLCCAMGQGVNGAPGQPLPKIWALLPRQSSARSAPARCLAWSRDGGGTKWVLGGSPAPLAPLRRPSRGTAAIFICLNSK